MPQDTRTGPLLDRWHDDLRRILRGEQPPESLLDSPEWSPEAMIMAASGTTDALDALVALLRGLHPQEPRPLRVMEIGARSGLTGQYLLSRLDGHSVEYIALDESPEMVLRAKARLRSFGQADSERWSRETCDKFCGRADIVLAHNALHRLDDSAIDALVALAAPGALLHVLEMRDTSPLALVTTELLVEADTLAARLRGLDHWRDVLEARGFSCIHTDVVGVNQRLVLHSPDIRYRPDARKLKEALASRLPSYMVPRQIRFLDTMPLSANGKIDHGALTRLAAADRDDDNARTEAPQNDAERLLAGLWQELITPTPDHVHRHSHFFEMGGDSLLATRLIGRIGELGYDASLGSLFDQPTIAAFAATLQPRSRPRPGIRPDPAERFAPFALTEIQQAYLVGRRPGFPLSGVGAHFFIEFEIDCLDTARFEAAWNRLIVRHDMLRAVVRDGRQCVLEHTPALTLRPRLFSSLDAPDLTTWREELSQKVLDPAHWPVFDVQIAQDHSGQTRVFISLDNMMLDGLSMQIVLAELEDLYHDPNHALPELTLTFRDYLTYRNAQPSSDDDIAYWRDRLDTLPPAPQLPLLAEPRDVGVPRFSRLSSHLSSEHWAALKQRARQAGLTPSATLLTAFGTVLSAWSARPDMTLNLTLFDRQPVHPQIEEILGDFTSLLLLAWSPATEWLESAYRFQHQLRQDLAHRDVSALWVMRQMARQQQSGIVNMPVVFTSALGFARERFLSRNATFIPRSGISQTPQIWLDHQVFETDGELHFNWDYVEPLFDPKDLRAMFDQYVGLLLRLADDPAAWRSHPDVLVPRRSQERARLSMPQRPVDSGREERAAVLTANPALIERIRTDFSEIVGHTIDVEQNFFDAGASSLELVHLHGRLCGAGFDELSVTDLFAYSTPRLLAAHISGAPSPTDPADSGRAKLLQQRRQRATRRRGQST